MRKYRNSVACVIAAFAALLVGSNAAAQTALPIEIGLIEAEQTCEYFREFEYRSELVASPYMIEASRELRSWVVKDCYSDFETLRSSLEAALASTGKIELSGGGYILDVTLSEVSPGGVAPRTPRTEDGAYATSASHSSVSLAINLRDHSGRSVFGSNFTKKIETGYEISASGERSWSRSSPEAAYGALQNEVARSIARLVVFHLAPMRVTRVNGTQAELNYGSPILDIGAVVFVEGEGGFSRLKYLVTSTSAGRAIAEPDGDYSNASLRPGTLVTFVESDSDTASARRYRRVPLP